MIYHFSTKNRQCFAESSIFFDKENYKRIWQNSWEYLVYAFILDVSFFIATKKSTLVWFTIQALRKHRLKSYFLNYPEKVVKLKKYTRLKVASVVRIFLKHKTVFNFDSLPSQSIHAIFLPKTSDTAF